MIIIGNTRISDDYFILECKDSQPLPCIKPGQFAHIKVEGNPSVYLRRPFSIHDCNYEKNTISFLIKIVGNGSATLSQLRENEVVSIVYPLGNGFSDEAAADGKSLLIGGGVGIAPIFFLAKELKRNNCDYDVLLGGKKVSDLLCYSQLKQFCSVFCTTEDGSEGTRGFVTDHEIMRNISRYDRIFCCGPTPMMKAVGKKACENGIFCEVSLENKMACGFGVCLCCVTPTNDGNRCVCTDGPVFNINELKW